MIVIKDGTWSVPVWCALVVVCFVVRGVCPVECYTCNVDFRSAPFKHNNTCMFPTRDSDRTTCSSNSRFCQGVITRINGIFVQLQRTCEVDCHETCTEKGYGIQTRECRFCCTKKPDCGREGYKSDAPASPMQAPAHIILLLVVAACLL